MKLATVDRLVRRFVPSVWLDRISGYDVFISYAQGDGIVYAQSIAKQLRDIGRTVFIDNEGIRDGEEIPARIEHGLDGARLLLLLATPMALESKWVRKERALYEARKTWVGGKRPIVVVSSTDSVDTVFEDIKVIRSGGAIEEVTNIAVEAVKKQVGWATSLRRLYSTLLSVILIVAVAITLLIRSLGASRIETIAQRWESVAKAAEASRLFSEAETAYRKGSAFSPGLLEEAKRVEAFRLLRPLTRISKPPNSRCYFAIRLQSGSLLIVYYGIDSQRISIRIDGQEVAFIDEVPASVVACEWVQRGESGWTLGISDNRQLWIIESFGGSISRCELVLDTGHDCFRLSSDGSAVALSFQGSEATVHRVQPGVSPVSQRYTPGRNLVGETRTVLTSASILCGTCLSSDSEDAVVAVAAYPQDDPQRACQIDFFRLDAKSDEFSLLASLPLQRIAEHQGGLSDWSAQVPDGVFAGEGKLLSARGLQVSRDLGFIALQFVQGENLFSSRLFHVILPAADLAQGASRTWTEALSKARQEVYLGERMVQSIFFVDYPFPSAVVHDGNLVQIHGLQQIPDFSRALTIEAGLCERGAMMSKRYQPFLVESRTSRLLTFKGEHLIKYSLSDSSEKFLAIHAGTSPLVVIESADSLYCYSLDGHPDVAPNDHGETQARGAGYDVSIDGTVRVPAFE